MITIIPISLQQSCRVAVLFCLGRWQQCCSILISSVGYLCMDLSRVFFTGNSTMNLERMPNEEKLSLCRRYYLGGFAFLPFLWLVNVLWFFKEAFLKPAYTEQPQIKSYIKKSALGLILWVAVLTTWITIFQHFRARWGEVGDYLSFTIPLGTA
uniref:Gamma-secretase subunit PEN-2 n=4 Tax=Cyprinus carpio TaxID=7962 RepID=A0A8C2IDU4_CYPCA